jgi:transcription elongation GreA/GreB family factor
MNIDPDKIKGRQPAMLQSAMADLTQHIEEAEEALDLATDPDYDAEERRDAREQIGTALEELFSEFEALQRICEERLT